MNLVYCMAGLYKRFRDAGYTTPKFLLPFRGSTVLEHVVGEMWDPAIFSDVFFVANERDRGYADEVRAVMARMGIGPDRITFIPDTRGQAETALLGLDALERVRGRDDEAVLFHNIDTVLVGRDYGAIAKALATSDGFIDVFDADSPIYSFVKADASGLVSEMAEKVVISRHATTGLYGFASGRLYRKWASGCAFAGEFYISDVYKAMLAGGCKILMNTSSQGHETIIIGTPREYEALMGERVDEWTRGGGRNQ